MILDHPNIIVACDPGEEGAFAIFRHDDSGWYLDKWIRTTNHTALVGEEVYPSLGVIEFNHGIQGQPAGTTYTQGYNAGLSHRTLEMLCTDVIKIIPQRWMKTFSVPKKNTFPGTASQKTTAQKNWTRDKVEKLTGEKVPLWASDAVAIGLSYIKELKDAT